jgi:hypothetical protein
LKEWTRDNLSSESGCEHLANTHRLAFDRRAFARISIGVGNQPIDVLIGNGLFDLIVVCHVASDCGVTRMGEALQDFEPSFKS